MRVEWMPGALEDLTRIMATLTEFSGEASALRRIRKIQRSVNLLRSTPEIGRRSDLSGVREPIVPDTPHIVGYRIFKSHIEVFAIRPAHHEFPSGGSWNQ